MIQLSSTLTVFLLFPPCPSLLWTLFIEKYIIQDYRSCTDTHIRVIQFQLSVEDKYLVKWSTLDSTNIEWKTLLSMCYHIQAMGFNGFSPLNSLWITCWRLTEDVGQLAERIQPHRVTFATDFAHASFGRPKSLECSHVVLYRHNLATRVKFRRETRRLPAHELGSNFILQALRWDAEIPFLCVFCHRCQLLTVLTIL